MDKACTKCNEIKALKEFGHNKNGKDGRHTWCRMCQAKHKKNWTKENPEESRRRARKSNLKQVYGITVEDYDRMLLSQNGRCKICGKMPKRKLFVDHNHKTLVIRGLLCHSCNIMLGNAEDKPIILRLAALYLEECG